jgi:hypothetical protein
MSSRACSAAAAQERRPVYDVFEWRWSRSDRQSGWVAAAVRCGTISSTFAPDNYYQRPDERKTGGLFAHYDFSDKASVYTEFMFMDDRTRSQVARAVRSSAAVRASRRSSAAARSTATIRFLSPDMVEQFCGGDRMRRMC